MSSSQRRAEEIDQTQAKIRAKSICLQPLTPQYDEAHHKVYVDHLLRELDNPNIHNIALSGPYGVGKSSILQGLKKYKPNAAFISLSTLGFDAVNVSNRSQSSDPDSSADQASLIQKEIVKQLLYRANPRKLPASRFKRIYRTPFKNLLGMSVTTAAAITLVSLALGLPDKLPLVSGQPWFDLLLKLAFIWLIFAIFSLVAGQRLQGRIHLEKVTAGPTTVSLSASTETYFDKYLDEMIYFFEVTKLRLVVFEDIDRFDNPEIFEQLRELNTLLNNVEQLKRNKHEDPIVFIYAVKDSIFDARQNPKTTSDTDGGRRDLATIEVERANRTKFFDLIIPVVPFVTHQSARDLLKQELKDVQPAVSPTLINLVAKHVPDLRLVRSACNEYQMYADQLLRDNGLELEPDKLFAMMLYKAVHMCDFEQIRLGKSNLDDVYQTSIWVSQQNIARLNREYDRLEKEMNAESEAKSRGEKLTELIRRIVATQNNQTNSFQIKVDDDIFAQQKIESVGFWDTIAGLGDDAELTVSSSDSSYPFGSNFNPIYLTKSLLAKFLGCDLVYDSPRATSAERLERELDRISSERERFRRATMSSLMKHGTVMPSEVSHKEDSSFLDYVEGSLGSKLATDLLQYDYIDRNFVLYTAIYQDTSLSASAMSFKIQHIDAGRMNTTYHLDDSDLKDLVPSLSPDELAQAGGYNVFILACLLRGSEAKDKHLISMIDALVRDDDDERQLLQDFFSSEVTTGVDTKQGNRLVALLAPKLPSMFTRIIELEGVSDDRQRHLMDVAFRSMADPTDYDTTGLKEFIETSYDKLESLNPTSSVHLDIGMVAELFQKAEVQIARLSALREDLREELIGNQSYKINRANLETATQGNEISLDWLKKNRQVCYEYVMAYLNEYLNALAEDGTEPTSALTGNEMAGEIVADLVKNNADVSFESVDETAGSTTSQHRLSALNRVLDHTDKSVMIALDESVPVECWPTLARRGRFAADTNNVLAYLTKIGLNEELADFLVRQEGIAGDAELEYERYLDIARPILEANDTLIGIDKRIELVKSLGSKEYISLDDITPTAGEMVGRLILAHIIEDSERAYGLTRNDDWPSREFAIASSNNFVEFMTPSIVANDALRIVKSECIDDSVKCKILKEPRSYCLGLDREDVQKVCHVAVGFSNLTLDEDALVFFMEYGGKTADVIALLGRAIDDLEDASIRSVVQLLGNPYADLLIPGVKEVRVPASSGLEGIIDRLKTVGAVSSYKPIDSGSEFKVYRRHQ
jgi:hypothetical protein